MRRKTTIQKQLQHALDALNYWEGKQPQKGTLARLTQHISTLRWVLNE